jgi:uncharacterized protein YigA (DUF484 family)
MGTFMETKNHTIQRLQAELATCQGIGIRNREILQHLRETNRKLNEAISAQAVHIEDLERELDNQLAELKALGEHVQQFGTSSGA